MRQILAIARKELDGYFGSAMALIFLAAFLAATLFAFFWVEAFFARGLADLRPLFRWLPVLLIFLVAALTMRQWSEEQRTGTLEMLLTLPVRPVQLVLGKFLAVLAMVALALALTLALPITVSRLGNLDWGPVIAGYLAALLLAAAYAAIGLFMSSRTDNQIVALIATGLVGGLFYMVGSGPVTELVGTRTGDLLRALGTGSRFASIERGVIDLRDLLYYLALTGIFLTLNVLSLQAKSWGRGLGAQVHRRRQVLLSGLLIANLVLVNVWLAPITVLRLDTTEAKEFSLSPVTRELLANLQEPLLIRAYISERTHPLLAPLAPQIADMLQEYAIAGRGLVTAEVVDPAKDPELEAEATQTYGIQPTPFQVAGRYEAAVISSYFDILVRYADQSVVLRYSDLIEVTPNRDGTIDVRLRNLEYDLTRAIKRVVYGFQSVDAILAAMDEPVHLTLVTTRNTLPEPLADAPEVIAQVAQEIAERSQGKLTFEIVDPDAPDARLTRRQLVEQYGLQPFPVSFFSPDSYYLHLLLEVGDQLHVVYPGGEIDEITARQAIEAVLKRSGGGFLRTVGLWTPPPEAMTDAFGQPQPGLVTWELLTQQLQQQYEVRNVTLADGQVPEGLDMLLVIAPQAMDDRQRFAIDQYLMRGGSVVLLAGNYRFAPDIFGGNLGIRPIEDGLQEMLRHYGIDVQEALVMDPQSQPFPVVVTRIINGLPVQELQAMDYPFFVDVRPDGMDRESPVVSNLPAVTVPWASPIQVDEAAAQDREVRVLLRSSDQAWLRTDLDIQPDFEQYPEYGFPVEGERRSYALAVSVQGTFESYFADRPLPWEAEAPAEASPGDPEAAPAEPTPTPPPVNVVERSPDTARLVVVGSASMVDDLVLNLSAQLTGDRYLNNLLFVQNAVDWAVEDLDLLRIRARGSYVRLLDPLSEAEQLRWELANYAVALVALLVVAGIWRWRRRHERPLIPSGPVPRRPADPAGEIAG